MPNYSLKTDLRPIGRLGNRTLLNLLRKRESLN